MRNENDILVDCLERLNQAGIAYALVGSMASNFWGTPRSTHDLDFVIVMQASDVESIAAAFQSGFFIQVQSIRSALAPPHQFNAIDEQSSIKVDFWLLRENSFDQVAFDRRQQTTLFGVKGWILTAEDVILHKLYWNSLTPSDRQILDAAGIYTVQGDALDFSYLRKWATELGVEQELDAIITGKTIPKST